MKFKSANRKQYLKRLEQLEKLMKFSVPAPILTSAMELVLASHYGSLSRAAFHMLRQAFYLWRMDVTGRLIMWICDRMGWTKLIHHKESEEFFERTERHGRYCPKRDYTATDPSHDCITESVPAWFRKLTRFDK